MEQPFENVKGQDDIRPRDVIVALGEIKKINAAINRSYNALLTNKQKRSKAYQDQYWGKVQNLSCKKTIEDNQRVYELKSLKYDRYEGQLDITNVVRGYESRDSLLNSPVMAFGPLSVGARSDNVRRAIELGQLRTFLFERMRQPFRLELYASGLRHVLSKEMLSCLVNVKELKLSGYVLAGWHTMENALEDLSSVVDAVELEKISICDGPYTDGNSTWLETVRDRVPYPSSNVSADGTYKVVTCSSTLD